MRGYELTGYVYELPKPTRGVKQLVDALGHIDGIRRIATNRYAVIVEVAKGTKGRSLSDIFREIELAYDSV